MENGLIFKVEDLIDFQESLISLKVVALEELDLNGIFLAKDCTYFWLCDACTKSASCSEKIINTG